MSSPVGHFHEITAALERGRPTPAGTIQIELSADAVRWLHSGTVKVATGEALELSSALGLRGRGINFTANVYEQEIRDQAIRAAFRLIDGKTPHARACRLLEHASRLRRVTRRFPLHDDPPPHLTEIQTHLWRAFQHGRPMPRTAQRIVEIFNSNDLF